MSAHANVPIDDREPVVDALLREHLGGETAPDQTALVLARWQRGDGADAAARAAQAARAAASVASARMRSPRLWLTAAAVLLGLCGVLSALLLRGDGRERAAAPPQEPQQPAPGVVPVENLEQLRALLPQVTAIEVEIQRLDVGTESIEVGGAALPVPEPAEVRAALADARVVARGEWPRQNRVDLLLPGGRRIAMAVRATATGADGRSLGPVADIPHDADVAGAQLTLCVQGLRGDLAVDCRQGHWLRKMIEAATNAARARHGIVRSAQDLDGDSALPADCERLRLFGELHGPDLAKLARFTRLQRLDLSGLRATLKPEDLTALGSVDALRTTLRELCLDGCLLCDDDLVGILPFVHLERLELRGVNGRTDAWLEKILEMAGENYPSRAEYEERLAACRRFTGEGFRHFSNSSARRDGPSAIDLSTCHLTDAGLAAIAQWSPRELVLTGAGGDISDTGWRALMSTRQIERLDLSNWRIDAARMRDLAARTDLVELSLRKCSLDDTAVAPLEAAHPPLLRRLDLTGNDGITAAKRVALWMRLTGVLVEPNLDDNRSSTLVRVASLEQLHGLLRDATWVQLQFDRVWADGETLFLPLERGPYLGGRPVDNATDPAQWFANARVEQPAGWEWPFTLRLLLTGNRMVELSVMDIERNGRWTVGLRGLQGDLSIESRDAQNLRQLVRSLLRSTRTALGIATSADLADPQALRDDVHELTLLGVAGADLAKLARFTNVQRLDLSHLAATFTAGDLRTITALPNLVQSLESVRLSRCTLRDADLLPLGDLRKLAELDLAEMPNVTGEFCRQLHPRPGVYPNLVRIDLSGCPLTDDGLLSVVIGGGQEQLLLRDAGGGITDRFWRGGTCPRSRCLDLSGWQLTASRVKLLAREAILERLLLARCGIDDEMLQVLADGTAPITSLDLDDNPAMTDSGLLPLLDLQGLRELSLRRCAKVTDTGVATLQQQRPYLQITR